MRCEDFPCCGHTVDDPCPPEPNEDGSYPCSCGRPRLPQCDRCAECQDRLERAVRMEDY